MKLQAEANEKSTLAAKVVEQEQLLAAIKGKQLELMREVEELQQASQGTPDEAKQELVAFQKQQAEKAAAGAPPDQQAAITGRCFGLTF